MLVQKLSFGRSLRAARPVFVVGCQRSGTNAFIQALDRCHKIRVYNEHANNSLYHEFRLRNPFDLAPTLKATKQRIAVFKPICDSHLTDQLLKTYPDSKVFWIFRNYASVAASMVDEWGDHFKKMIDAIHNGRAHDISWRGERLSPHSLEMVRRSWRPTLNAHEAAAIFWYLRNRFLLELNLCHHPSVMVVRYEDMCTDPRQCFVRVFNHVGLRFAPKYTWNIWLSPTGKELKEPIGQLVRDSCDELTRSICRLTLECESQGPSS